jgi:Putative bacterial sensory transduction regulator
MSARLSLAAALSLPALATVAWAQAPASEDAPARRDEAPASGQPRYLSAIQSELEALHIEATCQVGDPQRGGCEWTSHGSTSQRDFNVRLTYSDRTDTIYLYVQNYLEVAPNSRGVEPLMRRLMELNWQMLTGKFEWDPMHSEVRLSMTLNTDSNFDRRAFRAAVRGLLSLADRYATELGRVSRGE